MSGIAFDRQIRPIYDAIDTGSNKSAIVACNKVLKKYPKNDLVKALKSLALVRSQKIEESLVLADEVLATKPAEEAVLGVMAHVLRALGRHKDLVVMYDDAFKRSPGHEELGIQLFFANARSGNWKAAQQTASKLHKSFQDVRYLYWSVMSAILQANDPSTPEQMREVLYKLAHRLLESSPTTTLYSSERLYLHLTVLRELKLYDDAQKLLETSVGQAMCATNLSCDEIRRDICRLKGMVQEEGTRAQARILEKKDRNWLEFLAVLDSTFHSITSSEDDAEEKCKSKIAETQELFIKVQETDGDKDRTGSLALLYLEHRAREHGLSTDGSLVQLMEFYFEQVGDKACCFEDLRPFNSLEGEDRDAWISYLLSIKPPADSVGSLRRSINIEKLLRHQLAKEEVDAESEITRAATYTEKYVAGLQVGIDLPSTELQPADDFAILAAQTLANAWVLTSDESHLYKATSLLEFALTKSKHAFQIRLVLIRLYRLLGAPSLALEHYRTIGVKQVQSDTLSHFVLSRASTFSLAATGDLTWLTECMESSQIYLANTTETPEFTVKAFQVEKYTQIPEFVAFEDHLDNSFFRDVVKMEHVRMRFVHEALSSDMIDMELIELKFIFDRLHHDNRDFDILPNYQPASGQTFHQQTVLFNKTEQAGWLNSFLRLYIRALQQASNMDDTVEEKILVGDRPKMHVGSNAVPLAERIRVLNEEDLTELTSSEKDLVAYGKAFADWLQPYHDHARPPASVVLAEAAKLAAQKTGQPAKGFDLPPSETGTPKKPEDAPAVVDPPEILTTFFDGAKAQVLEAVDKKDYAEALHRAAIAQEALILFAIETLRFKETSVVKVNKFTGLVNSFKTIRTAALNSLKEVSSSLTKLAEEDAAECQKLVVNASSGLNINEDVVTETAKNITDARKKAIEGMAKGITRLCTTYKS